MTDGPGCIIQQSHALAAAFLQAAANAGALARKLGDPLLLLLPQRLMRGLTAKCSIR